MSKWGAFAERMEAKDVLEELVKMYPTFMHRIESSEKELAGIIQRLLKKRLSAVKQKLM